MQKTLQSATDKSKQNSQKCSSNPQEDIKKKTEMEYNKQKIKIKWQT